ncbi:hypothetical protein KAJ83_05385 [Marivibrio halodurans]|uniref:Uncharacterized protein n=1 Tax=Marivibrio halodurans TaxID=2039722 RepID=A0A8J7RXM2_9PROT|nr:hypothetical protein [Marivibrio halodurans]MBP5856430.1 hypothetical protein [Marivibrio halodurans]
MASQYMGVGPVAASFLKFFAMLLLVGMVAGCAQIEPSPTVREDGTFQFCPNPFNRHHVLMAARRHCAPLPAQPLGFETCPDDPLVDGWVFACRYNPGYDRLEIDDVRTKEPEEAKDADDPITDPDGDGAKAVEPAE